MSLDRDLLKVLQKSRNSIFAIFLGIMLTACGGSSGNDSPPLDQSTPEADDKQIVYIGEFTGPVEGLGYSCSGGTISLTDVNGTFTCREDDNITFYLGTYEIGSTTIEGHISPSMLSPGDRTVAVNIAQLIMTMDHDDNISNGIKVDTAHAALLDDCAVDLDAVDLDDVIVSYIGERLASETQTKRLYDIVESTVTGTLTKVVDGDTLYFDDDKCRIAHIDSPESSRNLKAKGDAERCEDLTLETLVEMGKQSTAYANDLVKVGMTYKYDVIGTDRYERSICIVHTPDGLFNELMVKEGYAVPYEQYIPQSLKQKYHLLATEAEQLKSGLWKTYDLECLGRVTSRPLPSQM